MMTRMAGARPLDALDGANTIESLGFPERLVVWTQRIWNRTVAPDGNHRAVLLEAYSKVGAQAAIASIDSALWVLRVGGRARPDRRCPYAGVLTADETRLLHVLACLQHGAGPAAQASLDALLAPTAVRTAHAPLSIWAGCLERSGLTLPFRDWDLPELGGNRFSAPMEKGRGKTTPRVLH